MALSTTWLFKNQTHLTGLGNLSTNYKQVWEDIGNIRWLHSLSAEIKDKVQYKIAETETNSSALDTVQKAWVYAKIMLISLQAVAGPLGFHRYVSGYLLLDEFEQRLRCMLEAFVPSLGWVGFDVSNGVSPDTKYVQL